MDQDSITIISDQKDKKIKVILIGDQCVGKSKLMEQMLNIESKVNDKQIQSVDFFISRITLPTKVYQKIYVWITSGEIKNIQMIRAFLLQCNIYILAFSLNNVVSLENALNTWFSCCVKNAKQTNAYYYFLGTMSDKERFCGTYNEIIKMIAEKCDELKVTQTPSKPSSSYEIRGIRQSERWNDDHIIEYATKTLPPNVYYSETSAMEGIGLERSISIFSKLVASALQIQDVVANQTIITKSTLEVQKKEFTEAQSKEEFKKQDKMCCSLF